MSSRRLCHRWNFRALNRVTGIRHDRKADSRDAWRTSEIQILSGFYYRQAYCDRSGRHFFKYYGESPGYLMGWKVYISPIQNLTAAGEILIMNYRLAFWVCFLGLVGTWYLQTDEFGMYISGHRCHKAGFLKTTDVMEFNWEKFRSILEVSNHVRYPR